jgi:putative ATP-binding cassette transporter
MKLVKFVLKNCRRMLVLTILAALLSGACNAGLIALVNVAINHRERTTGIIIGAFIALGVGRLLTSVYSQLISVRLSQGVIAKLRRDLVHSILRAPLRRLEEIGSARLMVALTDDIYHIAQSLLAVACTAVNGALLLGGAVYLAWLSWQVLAGLLGLVVLGAVGYRFLTKGAFRSLIQAREEEDRLFGHFRSLTLGIKELKLHQNRREVFFDRDIYQATEAFQQHNVKAESRFLISQHWSHLLFYLLIGLILFLLPAFSNISTEALTGYIITTLYLMGPLAGVLSTFSLFGRANVSLQKIEELGISLTTGNLETVVIPQKTELSFERLDLVGITHSYHHEKDGSHFVLGPVNLTFRPGELTFLVGGNGSGKSTLAKIITGLYLPEKGEIRLDGEPITERNREHFRGLFSAVFADFHLFETLLGIDQQNLDDSAKKYLAQLQLDHKVKISNGRLSTVDLSQGQRKRLALLTAYLEDRQFYLFDEWASDQDPQFKEIFYRELLPDLRRRGKTVLAITHDDKYFNCADRIIKLDFGQLISDRRLQTGNISSNGSTGHDPHPHSKEADIAFAASLR